MADVGELSTSLDIKLLRALGVDVSGDMFGLATSDIPDVELKVQHTEDSQPSSAQNETEHLSSQEKAEEGGHSALIPHHRSTWQFESKDSINSDVDEPLFNCGSGFSFGQKGDTYSTSLKEFLAQQQDTFGKIANLLKQRKEVLSFFEAIKPDKFYLVSKTDTKEIIVLPVSEEMFSKSFYEKGSEEEETQSPNEDFSGSLQPAPSRFELEENNMTVTTSPNTGRKLAFTCTCCPRQEATRSSLLTHLLSHGRPFCRLCFATYASKWSLERHVRKRHPASKLKTRGKFLPSSSPAKILVTSRYGRRRQVISASRLNAVRGKP